MSFLRDYHHPIRLLFEWAFTIHLCHIEGMMENELYCVTHKLWSIHGLDLLSIVLIL